MPKLIATCFVAGTDSGGGSGGGVGGVSNGGRSGISAMVLV